MSLLSNEIKNDKNVISKKKNGKFPSRNLNYLHKAPDSNTPTKLNKGKDDSTSTVKLSVLARKGKNPDKNFLSFLTNGFTTVENNNENNISNLNNKNENESYPLDINYKYENIIILNEKRKDSFEIEKPIPWSNSNSLNNNKNSKINEIDDIVENTTVNINTKHIDSISVLNSEKTYLKTEENIEKSTIKIHHDKNFSLKDEISSNKRMMEGITFIELDGTRSCTDSRNKSKSNMNHYAVDCNKLIYDEPSLQSIECANNNNYENVHNQSPKQTIIMPKICDRYNCQSYVRNKEEKENDKFLANVNMDINRAAHHTSDDIKQQKTLSSYSDNKFQRVVKFENTSNLIQIDQPRDSVESEFFNPNADLHENTDFIQTRPRDNNCNKLLYDHVTGQMVQPSLATSTKKKMYLAPYKSEITSRKNATLEKKEVNINSSKLSSKKRITFSDRYKKEQYSTNNFEKIRNVPISHEVKTSTPCRYEKKILGDVNKDNKNLDNHLVHNKNNLISSKNFIEDDSFRSKKLNSTGEVKKSYNSTKYLDDTKNINKKTKKYTLNLIKDRSEIEKPKTTKNNQKDDSSNVESTESVKVTNDDILIFSKSVVVVHPNETLKPEFIHNNSLNGYRPVLSKKEKKKNIEKSKVDKTSFHSEENGKNNLKKYNKKNHNERKKELKTEDTPEELKKATIYTEKSSSKIKKLSQKSIKKTFKDSYQQKNKNNSEINKKDMLHPIKSNEENNIHSSSLESTKYKGNKIPLITRCTIEKKTISNVKNVNTVDSHSSVGTENKKKQYQKKKIESTIIENSDKNIIKHINPIKKFKNHIDDPNKSDIQKLKPYYRVKQKVDTTSSTKSNSNNNIIIRTDHEKKIKPYYVVKKK